MNWKKKRYKVPAILILGFILTALSLGWVPSAGKKGEQSPSLWASSNRVTYEPFAISGYLPDYEIHRLEENSLRHLTDVIYFNVTPTNEGSITWNRIRDYHLEKLHALQSKFGFRLHLGVADHSLPRENAGIRFIIQYPELRQRFAKNLATVLERYQFDGADIDWEFPMNPQEAHQFTLLLEEIHKEFSPKGLRLSIAVSRYFPVEEAAYQYVNQVNLMAYDEPGRHSTTFNSINNLKVVSERQGARKDQVLLGVPFYGRGISQGRTWRDAIAYKTLREKYQVSSNQEVIDGYYFNGVSTVIDKVTQAWEEGAGGVMIWQIGQDSQDEYSLLGAMNQVIQEKESSLLRTRL